MADDLDPFLGLWLDPCGRAMFVRVKTAIERGHSQFPAFVRLADAAPLPRDGGRDVATSFPRVEMFALVKGDALHVEAGVIGLGPTYVLVLDGDRLVPSVQMGLYDDWEDDLGVPWAFPLEAYRRASQDERERWILARTTGGGRA